MMLLVMCALVTVATGAPGLLKVPRVYNAVITSNQNLSPSRAFPVIQPVIHRTAVGYVPPFYYTQIAPHFAGPEVVHYPPGGNAADGKLSAAGRDQTQAPSASHLAESTSFGVAREREDTSGDGVNENADAGGSKDTPAKKKKNEQLSFYPNYHSLYYEPYVYTYNSFNPHLVAGTYYVDYQPYGNSALEPIPPPANAPKNADPGRLLPGYHDEKRNRTKDEKEKIPDVPPPPLPTSVPKKS